MLIACFLALASLLTVPLLRATITQPLPPPFEPGTALPPPSPTPSNPDEEDGAESTVPAEEEGADNSQESDNAGEPSPTPVNPD
jgi:hypothetical protein